jgi:hypothetical protein
MEQNIITTKPLFEFSDIELKSIAFDLHEAIKNHENNLNLIRTELNRRIHSRVVATVTEKDFANIAK